VIVADALPLFQNLILYQISSPIFTVFTSSQFVKVFLIQRFGSFIDSISQFSLQISQFFPFFHSGDSGSHASVPFFSPSPQYSWYALHVFSAQFVLLHVHST
jgi:hypothetical protein